MAASGLVNRTPPAFTAANENETDPSPADMASVLDLIDHRQVSALIVNPQTSTAAITRVEAAARRAGVPVDRGDRDVARRHRLPDLAARTVDQLLAALRANR